MVLPFKDSILYGPVNSRRLGKSLGVNLMPRGEKHCSFDCLYCHYGRTTTLSLLPPGAALVASIDQVLQAVDSAFRSNLEFDYLTFSGNGEPTLYPWFSELVTRLKPLMKRLRPHMKLALLSNSTMIASHKIQEAMEEIDLPIMKLDCADEEIMRKLNRPPGEFDFAKMLQGLKEVKGITIQSLFVDGMACNVDQESIMKWIGAIGDIRPIAVQIYTIDRPTAYEALEIVPRGRLSSIARICQESTGVPVSVF